MLIFIIGLVATFGAVVSALNYYDNRNKPKLWVDKYGNLINFNTNDNAEVIYH